MATSERRSFVLRALAYVGMNASSRISAAFLMTVLSARRGPVHAEYAEMRRKARLEYAPKFETEGDFDEAFCGCARCPCCSGGVWAGEGNDPCRHHWRRACGDV